MSETFITSKEDRKWLLDVHGVKVPYHGIAILTGREDCPEYITTYARNHYQCEGVKYVQGAGDKYLPVRVPIMDPHKLAKAWGVRYTGDVSPLSYDGYWYKPGTWRNEGFASCIDVACVPDGPDGGRYIHICLLTILRREGNALQSALECCGQLDEWTKSHPLSNVRRDMEIESCKGYGHYELDNSDYRDPSIYGIIIPEGDEKPEDFADYIKTIGADPRNPDAVVWTEEKAWELINKLVSDMTW